MNADQAKFFNLAKRSIAAELNGEIAQWDFSEMLSQLKALIAQKSPEGDNKVTRNSIRHFCRHYLDMRGDAFIHAQLWISGAVLMSNNDVINVLRVLQRFHNGDLTDKTPQPKARPVPIPSDIKPDIKRTVVVHAVSTLNSLVAVAQSADVREKDLFDGDRMELRTAIEQICGAFGVTVAFPESAAAAHHQPLTRQDMSDIGLKTPRKRGARE